MNRTSASIVTIFVGALAGCGEKQPPAAQPAASASASAQAAPAPTERPWYLPSVKEDGGVTPYVSAYDGGMGPSKWAFSVEPTEKWDCPFPPQKERAGLMEARVFVRVTVDENGKPTDAEILEDPGGGFGKAAKKCAMGKAYTPARGPDGKPYKSTTYPFYLRYVDKPPSAPGMPARQD